MLLFKELIGWQEGQTFWEYIGEVVLVNLATLLWGVFAFVILYFGAKFLAWFVNCDAIKALDEAQKKRNQKERQKREEMIKASNNPLYKKSCPATPHGEICLIIWDNMYINYLICI